MEIRNRDHVSRKGLKAEHESREGLSLQRKIYIELKNSSSIGFSQTGVNEEFHQAKFISSNQP